MSPRPSTQDYEREVADFARRVSIFLSGGPGRRFRRRSDSAKLAGEGEALLLLLKRDCLRVELQMGSPTAPSSGPQAQENVSTLSRQLEAGRCQLQRLTSVLDELHSSRSAQTPARPATLSR